MLTKQNYIQIAKILNKFFVGFNTKMLIEDLCMYFRLDNPNFNDIKFVKEVYKK